MTHIQHLWKKRELLGYWTLREIRVRYKQSVLGVIWAVLQPAVLALVFSIVFSLIVRIPTDGIPYPIFVYTALVPWTFFSNSLGNGIPSIVSQMSLVTKTAFPREILPLGVLGATFVDFLAAFAVFAAMLVFYRIQLTIYVLWWPVLVLLQVFLSIGLLLIGSALNVLFRDIRFLIPLLIQVWMYATPIIYPVSLVPDWIRPLYFLNPMAGIIESYRNIFLRGIPPLWTALGIGAIMIIALLIFSFFVFKRVEPVFADII